MMKMRKTGLRLETSYRKEKDQPREKWKCGYVKLFRYDKQVVNSEFCITETSLWVSWLETKPHFRKCGYARLVIDYYKGVCTILGIPLFLNSLEEAVGFYEKLGFKEVITIKEKFRVIENKDYVWDVYDYVWLPPSLRRKRKIWVHGF